MSDIQSPTEFSINKYIDWIQMISVSWISFVWIKSECFHNKDSLQIVGTIITHDREVMIFFSPGVLFACVYVFSYNDVCPDDLIMKDWCHFNNICQVHRRGCLAA